MRAAQFVGRHRIEVAELPDPSPGPGEALVRVVYSGICGSDRGLWENEGSKEGVPGHEPAGVVAALGEGVGRVNVGDEVAVHAVIGCGECDYCARGSAVYCQARMGGVSGGYGELLVAPERNLVPLPEGFGLDQGCLLIDLTGTPYHAVKRSGAREGEWVVVFGAGPIGLMSIQCAAAAGARVISVEPIEYRREAAKEQGAVETIDPGKTDVAEAVHDLTGGGADRALECSGSPQAETTVLRCMKPEGRIVFVGENHKPIEVVPSRDFIRCGTEVCGSWYCHLSDVPDMLAAIAEGKLDPMRIVTHRVDLDDIADGFAAFFSREQGCLKAIVHFPQ